MGDERQDGVSTPKKHPAERPHPSASESRPGTILNDRLHSQLCS